MTPIFFVENFFRRKFFSSKFFSTKVNFRPKRFSTKNYFAYWIEWTGFWKKIFQYLEASVTTLILLINIFTYTSQRKNLKTYSFDSPVEIIFSTKKIFDETIFRRNNFSTRKIFGEKNFRRKNRYRWSNRVLLYK